jgi:hypothetical protein
VPRVGADGQAMGGGGRSDGLLQGHRSVRKKKKGGGVGALLSARVEGENKGGLATVVPCGGGGFQAWVAHGRAAAAAGPTAEGAGGCRRRGVWAAVWLACGLARGCGA